MTDRREADARPEIEEFRHTFPTFVRAEQEPVIAAGAFPSLRPTQTRAPSLTPQEQTQAAAALRAALDAGQVRYPGLANAMLQDPSKLWLMGEIQMMISAEPNEVSYDVSADLMEGLLSTNAQRLEYEHEIAHHETQQLFWHEIGSQYEPEDRDFIINALAQLTEAGANRVGGLALAWADSHGMEGDNQQQLLLNVLNWTANEQQYEQGQTGFFGFIDKLQEFTERNLVSPLINAGVGLIHGAEEAARREGLSVGQQTAYMFGIRPSEVAGEFGWWELVSGSVDALTEVGADPLSWVAGVGLGARATKLVPVAVRATTAGRVMAAARSLLPKPFTGAARQVSGGRFARVTYSLGAKSVDDLLAQTVKNGVAREAMDLIKAGNISRFSRLFPAWRGLSPNALRTIHEAVQTPEEFIEVLKSDALRAVLMSDDTLVDLTANARQSVVALEQAAGGARHGDMLRLYTPDEVIQMDNLRNFEATRSTPLQTGATVDEMFAADSAVAKQIGSFEHGDKTFTLWRAAEQSGKTEPITGITRPGAAGGWFVKDKQGTIQGGYNGRTLYSDVEGLMHSALRASEEAGDSFLPRLLSRAGGDGDFTLDGAKFLRKAIRDRRGRELDDLLSDQSLPRDLRLSAAKDRLRLNTFNMQGTDIRLLVEVPQRSKRVFSLRNATNIRGTGRLKTGVRRVAARATPGRIPNEIHLFDDWAGTDDLRRLGEHFGLQQDSLDDLIGQFVGLERGARQEWVWDTFLRRVGRETGVPAFEHQLVQFYSGAGVRNFSASGVDLLDDGRRIPMLETQMNATMPVPVEVMTQVFNRARSIGTRSKLAKAMGFNGRGLGKTAGRRNDLVKRLRRSLGDEATDMSDDQLYEMAYTLVSPNAGLDARGIWAGKMMPKVGSWAHSLHQWFTKSMLVLRPIQWMWRVALLEEPIRAHIFNLPSLYKNPLGYMGRMREAHYIANASKWAEANMSWGQDVVAQLVTGTRQNMVRRLDKFGLTGEIFADGIPQSARAVRQGIEGYVENVIYGRVRPSKLSPVKRLPWTVKNRAHSLATAERAMKKWQLPDGAKFHEMAAPIAGRLVSGYLGEAVGATHRKLYQYTPGLSNDEAFTHGRVWGANLTNFVESTFGRMALRRRAAQLAGQTPDVTGADVVNSTRWQFMAPDLRLKYADEADDIAVAERYLDDMLAVEINHLFRPFADELSPQDFSTLLDNFASTRQVSATIGGEAVKWDLRGANHGAGLRQVGDYVASVRRNPQAVIPNNLPAPSFDPRFMAEDDVGLPSRLANLVLQTFGEKATQTLNRRPAWLHTYKRHLDNYKALGVPLEGAQRLAIDHANKMINHVFFNMNEAPYYVARLNRVLPFFGAMYEVVGAWSYKMPVAVGGTWQAGIGEFARKFDRLIDGLVNIGLLSREVEEDGSSTVTLNLVPPSNDEASTKEAGRWLQGAGFKIINTLDQVVSTILNMEEGLGLRSQGYRLAAGHPLDPTDYGVLSFAQADVGFNPLTNVLVTSLAALIPGAGAPRREATQPGETLADAAQRLRVDWEELVRYNREVFIDTEGFGSSDLYNSLLGGVIDPETLVLPELFSLNLPGSSLWDALSDTFMPFGEIDSPLDLPANFVPSSWRWVMAGLALQNQPSDEFWKDSDMEGIFGGLLPEVNQAQAASQLNEAFMYLEAHDLVNGEGPFTRIIKKEERLAELKNQGKIDEANALYVELRLDHEAFLNRAWKVATESLISRGLTGNMLPTNPGHVRLEEEKIQQYWASREYADSLKLGSGETRLRNFTSMEEYENYKEQLAAWLQDPAGDRARATFRANNPQLMAYLTPKTFYSEPVPDINSYEEYQRQIESGEREPSPLHVTVWRARSAAIQADYYNKFIAEFGNEPLQAAAFALQNRQVYQELNDERDLAYQGLEMWDEMHGSVYNTWREKHYGDTETWAQDQIVDHLNKVRDNLGYLFELDDNFDIELDLDGIANLNSGIRGAIAEISNAIRGYNELTEDRGRRNAYEAAIHRYFEEIYIPYAERISDLYDQLPEVADKERQSLIYEEIKFVKNEYADTLAYLDDDTTTPFPNPLEYSWQGKSEEEQIIKRQQWVTRPIEWMDLDQVRRILEGNPQLEGYVPSERADFDIYRQYTLRRLELSEAFEANEITRTQHQGATDSLEEQLKRVLIQQGRGNEVVMMSLTPYEKLEVSGLLPSNLGIFGDYVRYYKQALAAAGETAGTMRGRRMVAPLYDLVEDAFYTDPLMRTTLQELGINLQDKVNLNSFLPWLFFDHSQER